MDAENMTLRVLTEIRDEMRAMHAEQRTTNEHLGRLDTKTNDVELGLRLTNERLAVIEDAVIDTSEHIRIVGRTVRLSLDAKRTHEERIDDLEERVAALERKRQ